MKHVESVRLSLTELQTSKKNLKSVNANFFRAVKRNTEEV